MAHHNLDPPYGGSRARGRHLGLLGGTTTLGDCRTALGYLAVPEHLVRGPVIREYESEFARTIGVRHAISFSAGRVGLYGLLGALAIGPGDEVLLQVPTHIVVANAIRFAGARPVYVDCRLDSYTMDLEHAERRITSRTRAMLLQHTFGIPVDMDAALALARRHGLVVIEDCVHSLGASYHGRPVGSFGHAAFFSTEETKTISTTMGGMVVTDDRILAGRMTAFQAECAWPSAGLTTRYLLKLLAYHVFTQPPIHGGMRRLYERIGQRQPLPRPTSAIELRGERPPSYTRRLSNAQAALGLRQLQRLGANVAHRRSIAEVITSWLSQRGFEVPKAPKGGDPAFVRFPLWVDDRSEAVHVTRDRVVLGTWFTSVLEEATSPSVGGYAMGSCPRAEAAARHLVNLPTHLRVRPDDAQGIASTLASRISLPRAGAAGKRVDLLSPAG